MCKIKKNKLKVALPILSFLPNLGGMEVGLHNHATQLKKKGHDPTVITSYSIYKKLKKKKYNLGYDVKCFPPFVFFIFQISTFLGFFYFKKIFQFFDSKYNFDFWHITSALPLGISFIKYAEEKKIPYLLRCVGEDIQLDETIGYGYSKKKKYEKLIKRYIPESKNLIATSESVVECYNKLGVSKSKVHYITNGVVLDNFKIQVNKISEKKKYGIDPQSFTMISVGRNHIKKNYDLIIEVAKILKVKSKFRFKFILVGKGVQQLQGKINYLNLNKYFLLFEDFPSTNLKNLYLPSQDLIKLYKISDIFIFPSVIESFGIVIIEAMAAGLPVIACKVPGSKDLIKNNRNGFLICKDNTQQFVDTINNFYGNKNLLKRIKLSCLGSVRKFDWIKVSDRYIDLYTKIIKKNKN